VHPPNLTSSAIITHEPKTKTDVAMSSSDDGGSVSLPIGYGSC